MLLCQSLRLKPWFGWVVGRPQSLRAVLNFGCLCRAPTTAGLRARTCRRGLQRRHSRLLVKALLSAAGAGSTRFCLFCRGRRIGMYELVFRRFFVLPGVRGDPCACPSTGCSARRSSGG